MHDDEALLVGTRCCFVWGTRKWQKWVLYEEEFAREMEAVAAKNLCSSSNSPCTPTNIWGSYKIQLVSFELWMNNPLASCGNYGLVVR